MRHLFTFPGLGWANIQLYSTIFIPLKNYIGISYKYILVLNFFYFLILCMYVYYIYYINYIHTIHNIFVISISYRSVELIAILAISCTFFLFMHTNKLNSRLKEMEVKLQPSEFSALGLTGNQINPRESSSK